MVSTVEMIWANMPLVRVCRIRKDGPKGVRVSAANESETKERILHGSPDLYK